MSFYTLLLFGHIIGALGFFSSIVIWFALLVAMHGAEQVEEVRTLSRLLKRYDSVMICSSLLLLAGGLLMAVTSWGLATSWILVSVIIVVLLALMSLGLINPRMRAIATLAAQLSDGPVPQALSTPIASPLLYSALTLRITLILGVVFLMVVKPSLGACLVAGGVAVVLGMGALGLGHVLRESPRRTGQ